jgi:multidrug efflux system outer membrane protein
LNGPRAALLLLALPGPWGCAVGPDYHRPEVPLPAAWSQPLKEPVAAVPGQPAAAPGQPAAAAGEPAAAWWSGFRDPVLDSLVERGLGQNLDLRVAQARVREARALRGGAEAAGYPSVGGSASYSRVRSSQTAFPVISGGSAGPGNSFFGRPQQDLFQAGFDASWEVDIFGGVRRSVEAARAEVAAAQENLHDTLVSLLAEVARNYLELRGFQRRLAIAGENIGSQEATLELTRSRFQAGLTSDLDVARAEAQLATTRSQVPLFSSAVEQSIHRLGLLLGAQPGALQAELSPAGALPETPPRVPVGLPSEVVRRRPDVRRAERELAAATARIGVAKADLFPRFKLVGTYGFESQKLRDLATSPSQFWSLGPNLSWPFFAAGLIRSRVQAAGAREEQALALYERAVLNSLLEVEDALSAHSSEKERQRLLGEAVSSSRRARDLAQELYRRGLVDFLSVLEAERTLYAAQDQLVQSDRAVLEDLVALYKATGGGWELVYPPAAQAD